MKYGLTNLLIAKSDSVVINGTDINFVLLNSFVETKKLVEENKQYVTVEMEIHNDDPQNYEDKLAHKICSLLSLGMGCTVNWIYKKNNEIVENIENAITGDYCTLDLIPTTQNNEILKFLFQTFDQYMNQNKKFDFIIRVLNDAKKENDFLETRSIKAAVALEMLKDYFVKANGIKKIEGSSQFGKLSSSISGKILEFYGNNSEELKCKLMKQNIPALNNYPFRYLLEKMFVEYKVSIEEECLSNIVKIRNSLIHTGEFIEELDPEDQYFLLITNIGMVILSILKYNGEYIDWTKLGVSGSTENQLRSSIIYN
jgi:hypothetical protein